MNEPDMNRVGEYANMRVGEYAKIERIAPGLLWGVVTAYTCSSKVKLALARFAANDLYAGKQRPRLKEDVIGFKYGRLRPIRVVGRTQSERAVLHCVCDCGQQTLVRIDSLRSGVVSCGCAMNEKLGGLDSRGNDLFKRAVQAMGKQYKPEADSIDRILADLPVLLE